MNLLGLAQNEEHYKQPCKRFLLKNIILKREQSDPVTPFIFSHDSCLEMFEFKTEELKAEQPHYFEDEDPIKLMTENLQMMQEKITDIYQLLSDLEFEQRTKFVDIEFFLKGNLEEVTDNNKKIQELQVEISCVKKEIDNINESLKLNNHSIQAVPFRIWILPFILAIMIFYIF